MAGPGTPLLFLDVDGPLIPFGAPPPGGYPVFRGDSAAAPGPGVNPLLARVDPALGGCLLSLPCELVWATTWMSDANECLSPRLGLPQLPIVDWPVAEGDEPAGLHGKTRALVARAAGRPFVWVDDEITATDRRWIAAHSPAPALLHRVDPQRGLTAADFATLDAWLRALPTRRALDSPTI
ncbi:HAD domain-containing protein [Kitasatospora sp. NPDC088160]|uniref:HAD domain-containing protein n=1 Tax=Kitasatospora sp. NPDC088160 TaxID=3364072 RepID=UPI0038214FAD